MLVAHDFYDRQLNATGKGSNHQQYEQKVIDGKVIVNDRASGKTWQKGGAPDTMTINGTAAYIEKLNAEKFAGFNDWRLPTLEEAMSLMERREGDKEQDEPHIDPVFDREWPILLTSDRTPDERDERVWIVHYDDGSASAETPSLNAYVRAVR